MNCGFFAILVWKFGSFFIFFSFFPCMYLFYTIIILTLKVMLYTDKTGDLYKSFNSTTTTLC